MIYTKTGDDGTTSLVGGTRVKKYDLRVQAYGEIDELVSVLGFVSTMLTNEDLKDEVAIIQNKLFICESIVACEKEELLDKMGDILDADVAFLEKKIDAMTAKLPKLNQFIIPSGSRTACTIHVARTLCRKCERLCVEVADNYGLNNNVLRYLNRLSDYLFTTARFVMKEKHKTERFWK
ncbi:MAG: cob(I)yrinic acid a,c-diamide adenosyltransferase [Bacteroidales bacterium]|mgnify:FL=1|nr:cob(I)yrinic acid a,c-diamide adenosyltransferase [Bacteroidales bacterium]